MRFGQHAPTPHIRHRNELCSPLATSFLVLDDPEPRQMGLVDWLRRLFGGASHEPGQPDVSRPAPRRRRPRVKLAPLRYRVAKADPQTPVESRRPYRFARPAVTGGWLDLSQSQDEDRLGRYDLPRFRHPEELARWLDVPVGLLAWLVHRFDDDQRPADEGAAHYVYRWISKRTGGRRLIEAPKPKLKHIQRRILDEILNRVPAHPAAHGSVVGRSVRSNAAPHAGQRVVVKLDLENFYPSVSFNRVTAIFRSLGYSREAAIWLGRLTTTALPASLVLQSSSNADLRPYLGRRLPQGAPTSAALANLSAFALDLRLAGLARSFGIQYTRYSDDLTFSGDERFLRSLAVFLPLVSQIVRSERFIINRNKRKVIRNNQRQTVTGVVVNSRPNVARRDFDVLKAILTNCIRRGPSTQNHDRHEKFAAHLLGRIGHVSQLNRARGERLLTLFRQIDWNR